MGTKAKKFFLVLMTGGNQPLPQALGQEESQNSMGARFESRREKYKNMRGKSGSWRRRKEPERKARMSELPLNSQEEKEGTSGDLVYHCRVMKEVYILFFFS